MSAADARVGAGPGALGLSLQEETAAAHAAWKERWQAGPRQLRHETLPVQYGEQAPDLGVIDRDDTTVMLSTLWQQQPCLLVFLRHYGCGCARDRVNGLAEQIAELEAAGVRVAAIGQGTPQRSAAFARKFGLRCELFSDPQGQAFAAYGLLEGPLWQMMDVTPERIAGLDSLVAGLCETRWAEGWPPVDNPWLLPGEFVIDSSGVIRFAYRYQYCGNYPDKGTLLGAIGHARALW